jgi:hypothetical protein
MNDAPAKGSIRPRRAVVVGAVVCVAIGFFAWQANRKGPMEHADLDSLRDDRARTALDNETESRIVAFCSDCHTLPPPESFPRERWHREVLRGYEFYARSGRNDLDPPPLHQTLAYYLARAPERIVFPKPVEAATKLSVTFDVERLALDGGANVVPEISHLRWARLEPDGDPLLLVCDMRFGYVAAADLSEPGAQPKILARLANPCHVEPCDLDRDGRIDLVVADLGSFRPADHDRGRVVWLRPAQPGGPFEEVAVASGLGRVADVRSADFDGDGDLDLIVAEFGHYRTGSILLLRNMAPPGQRPHFEPKTIDRRPGTIHVPVYDFNGDGLPDFAALVSQEWEHVEAFVNLGDGRFHLHNLWAGPDLTYGSSGIELVDLDQDGDLDVLYTNGDAWDNWYVTPSHGVQWLENRGHLQFGHHWLTSFPGAYRALAGDVDLDGDLDVIAVAWLPPMAKPSSVLDTTPISIICLEQTEPGRFVRHTLEAGSPYYATMELADFDGDGDLDFAAGPGPLVANALKSPYWLSIWWNQTICGSCGSGRKASGGMRALP